MFRLQASHGGYIWSGASTPTWHAVREFLQKYVLCTPDAKAKTITPIDLEEAFKSPQRDTLDHILCEFGAF